jgi:hypothetical protein
MRYYILTVVYLLVFFTTVGCGHIAAPPTSQTTASDQTQTTLPVHSLAQLTDTAIVIINPETTPTTTLATIPADHPEQVIWDHTTQTLYWIERAHFDLLSDGATGADWKALARSRILDGRVDHLYWSRRSLEQLAVQPGGQWLTINEGGYTSTLNPETGVTHRIADESSAMVWSPNQLAVWVTTPTDSRYIILGNDGTVASQLTIMKRPLLSPVFADEKTVYGIQLTDNAAQLVSVDLRSSRVTDVVTLPDDIAVKAAHVMLSPTRSQAVVMMSAADAVIGTAVVVDLEAKTTHRLSDAVRPLAWIDDDIVWILKRPQPTPVVGQWSVWSIQATSAISTPVLAATTLLVPLF